MENKERLEELRRIVPNKTEAELAEIMQLIEATAEAEVNYFFSLSTVQNIMQSGDEKAIAELQQYTNEKGIAAAIKHYATAAELEARETKKAAAQAARIEDLSNKHIKNLAMLNLYFEELPTRSPDSQADFIELYKKHINNMLTMTEGETEPALLVIRQNYESLLEQLKEIESKIETTTDPIEADILQGQLDRIQYDILPTSSPLYLFNTALTYHSKKKNIPTTKNGTKKSDRHKEISYSKANGGGYTITQTDKRTGERVELTLTNADKMQGKGVKKCFAFLLTMSNKQNFSPVIGFSLQELVDRGMYKNFDTARVGLKNALDTLQNIKFSGTIKKGKKKEIKQAEAGVLFYHYKIKNNYVEVSVNENFNIEFIAAYYALFPQFAYRLSNSNAFDLCEYIFMRARQNTAEIKNGNSFNISFKRIRELLALPTDKEIENRYNRQGKRYIIDPILTAIKDIQQEATAANNKEFTLQAVYQNNYQNLGEFLEGYIQISFNGELYNKLSEIAEKQEAKIAQAMAIKEKKKLPAPKNKTDN